MPAGWAEPVAAAETSNDWREMASYSNPIGIVVEETTDVAGALPRLVPFAGCGLPAPAALSNRKIVVSSRALSDGTSYWVSVTIDLCKSAKELRRGGPRYTEVPCSWQYAVAGAATH